MLGKIAGAWLGQKVAGPNKGTKGAIARLWRGRAGAAQRPGAGRASPRGWGFSKWKERRARRPLIRRRRRPRRPERAARNMARPCR